MRTIGISYSGVHDSSACFTEDRKLLYAISEERLTRKTHDASYPINSIKSGLDYLSWTPESVDYVVIAWSNPVKHLLKEILIAGKISFSLDYMIRFFISKLKSIWTNGYFKRYEKHFGKTKFLFCDHHFAHALSSFSYSKFDEATVIVIDGSGAFEATSIWHGKNNKLIPVEIIQYPNSVGLFYSKFTQFLGFKPLSDEWKVMGLAAYGKEGIDLTDFISHSNSHYKVNWKSLLKKDTSGTLGIEEVLGKRKNEEDNFNEDTKNIAYAVQKETERTILEILEYSVKKTDSNNICLSGGVCLNCKANGLIANSPLVNDIFIQPAASDEGAALGAAIYPYLLVNNQIPRINMEHIYLGIDYTNEYIEGILKSYKINYEKLKNRSALIANEIASGKIIGHFNGRMEFGARALGNRSILADPRDIKTKDKVNNSVKYREWWRPFAPSIMEEHYFDFFNTRFLSPYMILSFPVKEEQKNKIPASIHIDGTARPQSVNKRTNQAYWEILNEFYKLTGVPAILNTSFNLKGEPIVCSPFDAIRTFFTSGLDVLILGDFLIKKN